MLSCELTRGVYKLLAFTSGCRFQRRTSEPRQAAELVKKKDDKVVLTKAFKYAACISSIFEITGVGNFLFLETFSALLYIIHASAAYSVGRRWHNVFDCPSMHLYVHAYLRTCPVEAFFDQLAINC